MEALSGLMCGSMSFGHSLDRRTSIPGRLDQRDERATYHHQANYEQDQH